MPPSGMFLPCIPILETQSKAQDDKIHQGESGAGIQTDRLQTKSPYHWIYWEERSALSSTTEIKSRMVSMTQAMHMWYYLPSPTTSPHGFWWPLFCVKVALESLTRFYAYIVVNSLLTCFVD